MSTTGPPPSVLTALHSRRESLPPSLRRVADYVLADPARTATATIGQIAAAVGTSESTLVRLARSIGLDGYRAFRDALVAEVAVGASVQRDEALHGDLDPSDDLAAMVGKIGRSDARAVADTAEGLSIVSLQRVIELLVAARRIVVFGVGASSFVAFDLHQKLARIGRQAVAPADLHMALTAAALLTDQDALVVISHSGRTTDVRDVADVAQGHGCPTVTVTNDPSAPLAARSDLVLATAAREAGFRSGATASRIAQLTVVDCVFVGVAQATYEDSRKALALTHRAVQDRRR